MSPWSDAKQVASHAVEPEFTLPACYHVQPQPVQTKLPQFHEETLFFIFYSQPRDLMQELAALELYVNACLFTHSSLFQTSLSLIVPLQIFAD